jgi:hypothetical protein
MLGVLGLRVDDVPDELLPEDLDPPSDDEGKSEGG